MDKRVREISPFLVAPPRVFPLSVRARPRTVLSTNTSSLVQHIQQPMTRCKSKVDGDVVNHAFARLPTNNEAFPTFPRESNFFTTVL